MKAPRVTLDQWRTLQAVVDHGGFAQAAEALHRSQSSVSYTVARMQEQLGAPLLRIERLTHADDRPIDFEFLFYRGDAFQYRLRIERS